MDYNSPWLTMWVRPRETIRSIVAENPKRSLWILAFVYGLSSLLNGFQSMPIANQVGLNGMLLIALVLAPFWGYAFFAIWGWVIFWTGKLLNGQADFNAVRAAYAWSCVPLVGNIPLWILLTCFYSEFLFFGVQDRIVVPGAVAMLFLLLVGKLVLAIWSIVLYLQALSEVQKYSVFRAILNVILASLIVGIAAIIFWSICIYTFHIAVGPSIAFDWHGVRGLT